MKSGCGRGMRHAPEVWKGEVGMPGISGDSDKPDRRPDLTGRPEHQLRSSGPTSPSRHTRNTRNSRNSRKRPIPHRALTAARIHARLLNCKTPKPSHWQSPYNITLSLRAEWIISGNFWNVKNAFEGPAQSLRPEPPRDRTKPILGN